MDGLDLQHWTEHPASFVTRRTLKLPGRHAHKVPKHRCEVRLILEAHSERDLDNFPVALTQKLLRTIDSLLQNELMWRQAGAALKQLGEVRLAHLRQPAQRAHRQRLVQMVSDVLDNACQASRGHAELLLARKV